MIPRDLPEEYRVDLRAAFVARMNRAKNLEWSRFWDTEVMFLDNRGAAAALQLHELAASEDRDVAFAALLSLGEWYEQSGAVDLAHEAYAQVIERDRAASLSVLARTKLAHLHNQTHQAALAGEVLETVAASIENVPPGAVQFVVTEYCRALRDLGRLDEARTFVRRVIASFPDRIELSLLAEQLLGAPD